MHGLIGCQTNCNLPPQDELLWSSAWLYRATKDAQYLDFLSDNQGSSNPVNEFSWDNKQAGAQMLATQVGHLDFKLCKCFRKASTP